MVHFGEYLRQAANKTLIAKLAKKGRKVREEKLAKS